MDFAEIIYEKKDRVATVTMNRPEKMNAWTPKMGAEMRTAMLDAERDPSIGAIIITGAGRAYCAGADMGGEGSGEEQDQPDRGGDPERPHTQQPKHEPGRPGALEDRERRQPGPRHAYLSHVGEEPPGLCEIDGSGPGVGPDRGDGDGYVSGEHCGRTSSCSTIKPRRMPATRPIHVSIT